jgi:hypothetical protein
MFREVRLVLSRSTPTLLEDFAGAAALVLMLVTALNLPAIL